MKRTESQPIELGGLRAIRISEASLDCLSRGELAQLHLRLIAAGEEVPA